MRTSLLPKFITFYNEDRVFYTHKVDDIEYMEYKADSLCLDIYFRFTEAIVKYSLQGEEANKLWIALRENDVGELFFAQQTAIPNAIPHSYVKVMG